MIARSPVQLRRGLTIVVGEASARITPHDGFALAQALLRASSRELVAQEAARAVRPLIAAPVARKAQAR